MVGVGRARYWVELRERVDHRQRRAVQAMAKRERPLEALGALLPHALRTLGTCHFLTRAIAKALEDQNEQVARWVLMMAPTYLPPNLKSIKSPSPSNGGTEGAV